MTNPRDVVHSLANHLAVILGFAELLLQETAPDDPRRKDLGEIHKAATAAVRMVSSVGVPAAPAGDPPPAIETRPDDLDGVERNHIVRVLAEAHGNKLAAARRLGISRRTLYRRLERHGLAAAPPREPATPSPEKD